jgi:hypothetical protein
MNFRSASWPLPPTKTTSNTHTHTILHTLATTQTIANARFTLCLWFAFTFTKILLKPSISLFTSLRNHYRPLLLLVRSLWTLFDKVYAQHFRCFCARPRRSSLFALICLHICSSSCTSFGHLVRPFCSSNVALPLWVCLSLFVRKQTDELYPEYAEEKSGVTSVASHFRFRLHSIHLLIRPNYHYRRLACLSSLYHIDTHSKGRDEFHRHLIWWTTRYLPLSLSLFLPRPLPSHFHKGQLRRDATLVYLPFTSARKHLSPFVGSCPHPLLRLHSLCTSFRPLDSLTEVTLTLSLFLSHFLLCFFTLRNTFLIFAIHELSEYNFLFSFLLWPEGLARSILNLPWRSHSFLPFIQTVSQYVQAFEQCYLLATLLAVINPWIVGCSYASNKHY